MAWTGVRAIRNAVFLAAIKLNIAITAPIAFKMPLKMHSMQMQKYCPGGGREEEGEGRTHMLTVCVCARVCVIDREESATNSNNFCCHFENQRNKT